MKIETIREFEEEKTSIEKKNLSIYSPKNIIDNSEDQPADYFFLREIMPKGAFCNLLDKPENGIHEYEKTIHYDWNIYKTLKIFISHDEYKNLFFERKLEQKHISSIAKYASLIKLEEGKYLANIFGKYEPNLTFILDMKEDWEWKQDVSEKSLNIEKDGTLYSLRGDFFVSKKGSNCFEIKKDGKHYLLKQDWGGAFNKTRGLTLPERSEGALYYNRARSNGGGSGNTYSVISIFWKRKVSIDDI